MAYDSGYRHLGLFNAMFKKRFGMTPGEWRQRNMRQKNPGPARHMPSRSAVFAGIAMLALVLNFILPARAQTNSSFDVEDYAVNANTQLSPQLLLRVFFRYTGTNVSLEEIGAAAADLQLAYQKEGHPSMSVSVTPLDMTNGTVTMNVFHGATPQILLAGERYYRSPRYPPINLNLPVVESVLPRQPQVAMTMPNMATNAATATTTNKGPRFKVERYLISGDTILTPGEIAAVFTNQPKSFGTNVTVADIRTALGDLDLAYRERGYMTVGVSLPQQRLTNAEVKVDVTEGRLASINVVSNRWFSSNNVMSALPDLMTNSLLNAKIFQRDLDAANQSRDRTIYPIIGPGPEPGTSELTLKVKDRFPMHMRDEVNNESPPGTPSLRDNFNMQYDNLWGLEHQVGLQYSYAFEEFKTLDDFSKTPFDDPLIANYSAYYRLPLGGYESVQQEINDNPGKFGYNEITHQFVMPPMAARPEMTFYASRSVSDTGVQLGQSGYLLPPITRSQILMERSISLLH